MFYDPLDSYLIFLNFHFIISIFWQHGTFMESWSGWGCTWICWTSEGCGGSSIQRCSSCVNRKKKNSQGNYCSIWNHNVLRFLKDKHLWCVYVIDSNSIFFISKDPSSYMLSAGQNGCTNRFCPLNQLNVTIDAIKPFKIPIKFNIVF